MKLTLLSPYMFAEGCARLVGWGWYVLWQRAQSLCSQRVCSADKAMLRPRRRVMDVWAWLPTVKEN